MINLVRQDAIRKLVPSFLKEIIVAILTTPLIGQLFKYKAWVNSKGCIFFVNHPRISAREAAAIYWGHRERAEVDFVRRLLPINADSTVIELGGSIGVVAAHVVKLKPKRMIVLEADPEIIELCKININANRSEETEVDFINKAVSYADDAMVKFLPGSTTTSGKINQSSVSLAGITVESITLSEIVSNYSVNDYILISDIEGSESDIWFQDGNALERCSAIVVEIEDTKKYSAQDQIHQIKSLGFTENYHYGRVYFFEKPLS